MELYLIAVWIFVVLFIAGSIILVRIADAEVAKPLPETKKINKDKKNKK